VHPAPGNPAFLQQSKAMSSSVGARLNADLLEEKYAQWSDDPR